jgi:predicted dehydrogenase
MNIVIVGCGAVTEISHLPALAKLGVTPAALVDRDGERARELAEAVGVPVAAVALEEVADPIDGAVVATPPASHRGITLELIQRGAHVLVEKPLALTAVEGEEMVRTAVDAGVTLSVGLMRRRLAAARWVQAALAAGVLGTIESFRFEEGGRYNWPIATDSSFRQETAGGGVLIDTGAHTLDLLQWWLGDSDVVDYRDDSYGGVEADCRIELELAVGGRGTVGLSRTRAMPNTAWISGSRGSLEVSLIENRIVTDPPSLARQSFADFRADRLPEQGFEELFVGQLEGWMRAMRGDTGDTVSATEALATMGLIADCYANRRSLEMGWMQPVSSGGGDR